MGRNVRSKRKEDIVTDNLKVIETMLEKAGITDLYFPVAATVKSALFTYFEGFSIYL